MTLWSPTLNLIHLPVDIKFRTINTDGSITEFPAHKPVLACTSKVFYEQFFGISPVRSTNDIVKTDYRMIYYHKLVFFLHQTTNCAGAYNS